MLGGELQRGFWLWLDCLRRAGCGTKHSGYGGLACSRRAGCGTKVSGYGGPACSRRAGCSWHKRFLAVSGQLVGLPVRVARGVAKKFLAIMGLPARVARGEAQRFLASGGLACSCRAGCCTKVPGCG